MGKKQTEGRFWLAVHETERALIRDAAKEAENHVPTMARLLGMDQSTLHKKIRDLEITDIPVRRYFKRAKDSWDPAVRAAAQAANRARGKKISTSRSRSASVPSSPPSPASRTQGAPSAAAPSPRAPASTARAQGSGAWAWARK